MIINRVIDNAAVAAASLTRAPVSAARQQALDHAGLDRRRRRDRVRLRDRPAARARNGRRGRTASPCASSTTTTRSSRPSTRTPATTSRRSSPSPSTSARTAGALVRGIATGYEIQIDLVQGDLACTSTRSTTSPTSARRPPPASARSSASTSRDDLPGHRPGAAHHHRHAAVPQGRDLDVEGARPRVRRQDGGRGGRPRDARRDQRRARSTRARTASSPGCSTGPDASYEVPLPDRGRGQARASSTRTRRSTRPSTRRRRWIDLARKLARREPAILATRRTSSRSCCTPATTPTT